MHVVLRYEAKSLDLKRYFTGKPCKNGHVSEKQTSNGECLQCASLRVKSPVDPVRKKINDEKYYKTHKSKINKAQKQYYENNKEKLKESFKIWISENKESNSEYKKLWRLQNLDRLKLEARERRQTYPWKCNNINAKRRASKRKAIPKWVDLKKIKEVYRDKPVGMVVDHMVPLISPYVCGLHVHENLQYLTSEANLSKSNLFWPDMW